jgi:hypothetical protein
LYKNGGGNPSINDSTPDFTGYAYRDKNWPPEDLSDPKMRHAYDSLTRSGNFKQQRACFSSYSSGCTTTTDDIQVGDSITGLDLKGGYKTTEMGTHGTVGDRALGKLGANRRIATVPFVDAANKVVGWGCVLMLSPIDNVQTTISIEYIGSASDLSSPCVTYGLAGGSGGPLIPTLVQ